MAESDRPQNFKQDTERWQQSARQLQQRDLNSPLVKRAASEAGATLVRKFINPQIDSLISSTRQQFRDPGMPREQKPLSHSFLAESLEDFKDEDYQQAAGPVLTAIGAALRSADDAEPMQDDVKLEPVGVASRQQTALIDVFATSRNPSYKPPRSTLAANAIYSLTHPTRTRR